MNVEIIEQLEHAFEGLDIMEQDVQLVFVILDGSHKNICYDGQDIINILLYKHCQQYDSK